MDCYDELLQSTEDAEVAADCARVKEDLRSLCRAAHTYDHKHGHGGSLVGFLEETRVEPAGVLTSEEDTRLTISTIHGAKGTEAQIVFVIGCEEATPADRLRDRQRRPAAHRRGAAPVLRRRDEGEGPPHVHHSRRAPGHTNPGAVALPEGGRTMTATQHTPAASHDERIAFGGYSRDGADHTVVAVRDHATPWRLLDVTGETVTVIESFFPDEGPDQCRRSPNCTSRRCARRRRKTRWRTGEGKPCGNCYGLISPRTGAWRMPGPGARCDRPYWEAEPQNATFVVMGYFDDRLDLRDMRRRRHSGARRARLRSSS